MEKSSALTTAQKEILDMVSFAKNEDLLSVLKEAIANYCIVMVEKEINSM